MLFLFSMISKLANGLLSCFHKSEIKKKKRISKLINKKQISATGLLLAVCIFNEPFHTLISILKIDWDLASTYFALELLKNHALYLTYYYWHSYITVLLREFDM